MIHVEMLFVKPGTTPLTYIKDLEVLPDLGALEVEGKILALPFIRVAEEKGFTLKCYDWHISSQD
jgi:hypothetical protein